MSALRNRWVQLSALAALMAGIGIKALRLKFCVRDSDIWWHLKGIIDHWSLPHTGILSRTVADRRLVAYSWGYAVLLSRAYAWFGVAGHRLIWGAVDAGEWPWRFSG